MFGSASPLVLPPHITHNVVSSSPSPPTPAFSPPIQQSFMERPVFFFPQWLCLSTLSQLEVLHVFIHVQPPLSGMGLQHTPLPPRRVGCPPHPWSLSFALLCNIQCRWQNLGYLALPQIPSFFGGFSLLFCSKYYLFHFKSM